jgi:hypothetical protein
MLQNSQYAVPIFRKVFPAQKNRCVTSLVGHALHLMFGEL